MQENKRPSPLYRAVVEVGGTREPKPMVLVYHVLETNTSISKMSEKAAFVSPCTVSSAPPAEAKQLNIR